MAVKRVLLVPLIRHTCAVEVPLDCKRFIFWGRSPPRLYLLFLFAVALVTSSLSVLISSISADMRHLALRDYQEKPLARSSLTNSASGAMRRPSRQSILRGKQSLAGMNYILGGRLSCGTYLKGFSPQCSVCRPRCDITYPFRGAVPAHQSVYPPP